MLLTIVTINLNDETGLRRTIASVRPVLSNQIQYLVLDGLSRDGSQQVLAEAIASDPRIEGLVEPDKGIYDAMNKGWRRARGTYVAYLNSGDELVPQAYLRFVEFLAHQTADVCYAKTFIRSVDGSQQRVHERHPHDFKRSTIPHPTAAVRRDVMAKAGGFDETYRICADRELFIRLKSRGACFAFLNEVTTIFYEGGASASRNTRLEDLKINFRYGHISKTRYFVKLGLFKLQREMRKLARG